MLKSISSSDDHLLSLIVSSTGKLHLRQIHAVLLRTSLIRNSDVFHHFFSRLALSLIPRDINYSCRVFSQRLNPTLSHCNTMIRAFSLSQTPCEGFRLFRALRRNISFPANPLSSSFALKCCIKSGDLLGGLQIHGKIFSDGFLSDSLLMTTLMDLYSTCENSTDACKVFDEIPQRDTVSWNVLISCYLRNKRTRDVLVLFDKMKNDVDRCVKPDNVTCLLALQACANLGALDFGKQVHDFIDENGLSGALNLSNTLVSMYSRCGSMDKAYEVFNRMRERNVVSWTAMISGLAMNGFGKEAIEAFNEMLKFGISPEEQTLTGLLSACSHSGLVDEGMMFFDRMRSGEFKIKPNLHHYGCIVDLLGRARLLDKAYSLIKSMEMKPDSTIWRTLLGACRVHGNVELGERVIAHLIEFKAEEAGDYVLLLNTYSSVGKWEKVTELRSLMKKKRIQTNPGCSAIELQGTVHEFIVDDVSHPRKEEIYKMLAEINQQLKIAGYVAEITSELHNLDSEEEKGYALRYHSEKLAIAFGILVTPPETTIRVTKNLRTCVDCHNFAKFVSDVYDRVVIVRDRSRFHHFKGGSCSCNDFW
ncbi:pentatricopeptide repeat-containing protein At3g47530 [Arabidopsis lyrata subsp. lyrata]|uniref:pentatricopeptide repeat-containing protein At3g47530 n=1 Tax=Arabidopsis lyrata subsp. lyrata TaxID=81972 RepID=UPI000A29C791|nr:pentatricopeptide repeat-containing protein At3g47530 [Arabidopsis lyrata subsp. lyrata]|eukprot:XP_020882603.1 pentatricopeptide repeat-containing protein At3g47530 [Arabidopsis lyrata subsp. lyrata]